MRADLINPFISASKDILAQMAQLPCEMGKIFVKESSFPAQNVAIIIGLTGKIKGQVVISMNDTTGKKIASNMMGGMPVAVLDDLSRSAISELGNMILGNAATLLYNQGMAIDITPPTLLVGDNLSVSTNQSQTICIPLITEAGTIEMDVAIKE